MTDNDPMLQRAIESCGNCRRSTLTLHVASLAPYGRFAQSMSQVRELRRAVDRFECGAPSNGGGRSDVGSSYA